MVGIARNKVLEQMAEPFMDEAKKAFDQSGVKQCNFHEITYAAKTWDRQRRVVVKAEVLPKGPNARLVVTNLADDPETIYDERYTARGDMENRIVGQSPSDDDSCQALQDCRPRDRVGSADCL